MKITPDYINGKRKVLLIAISTYTSGDAQSTRVDDIAESVKNTFDVIVITSYADPNRMKQSFPEILVKKNYYLSFMSKDIKKIFKTAELVIVETGLPYAFCSFLNEIKFIWILYGPDVGIRFSGSYILMNRLNILLERKFLLKSAKVLITPADWVSNFYREKGLNAISIPAAIDRSIFWRARKKKIDVNNIRLLMVGYWDGFHGRKRQHEFIKILPSIVEHFPNIRVTIAGLDLLSMYTLERLAITLGLSEKIYFVGRLSPKEVANVMNESDIFISNTISDAFYRIIIEAFGCGLPAIARDATGIIPDFHLAPKHHILNSRAGVLYDGSSSSFLIALKEVIQKYELFSENAIRYAQQFDREGILKKYHDLIISSIEN